MVCVYCQLQLLFFSISASGKRTILCPFTPGTHGGEALERKLYLPHLRQALRARALPALAHAASRGREAPRVPRLRVALPPDQHPQGPHGHPQTAHAAKVRRDWEGGGGVGWWWSVMVGWGGGGVGWWWWWSVMVGWGGGGGGV